MTNTPTPEAIVKAALERAAEADVKYPSNESLEYQNGWDHAGLAIQEAILTLASDQAEVAQIIQNAGGQTDPYLYAVCYDVGFEDGFKDGFKECIHLLQSAEAKLAKAVKALEKIAQHDTQALALNTLAELKGDSDEQTTDSHDY